jgi:UDP-glucuronate 4-epimerase
MKVLVTGGAGFIGSHVVERLLARGDDVRVLDSFEPSYAPARKEANLAQSLARVRLLRADLGDTEALDRVMRGVDAVIHLAARAGVRRSLADPGPYLRTNVEGTAALLEAMRRHGVDRLVNASSSSVYGARSDGPFREDDPLGVPASPYAASKRAAELLCETWHRLHGLRVTTLRFFTVYGPRQRPDMAIDRFTRAAFDGRPIRLFGDGSSLRDYTYVDDTVRGVLAALDRPLEGAPVFNLGNGRPVSLRDLVSALEDALGRPVEALWEPEQAGDVPMTWADTEKARETLGFECGVALAEGLQRFVGWLRDERVRVASCPGP